MRFSKRYFDRILAIESLESRQLLAVSNIQIRAAGATGTEQMQLQIDGEVVQTWDNIGGDIATGEHRQFSYTHPTEVAPGSVRIAFSNDGSTATGNRDLFVDGISIDGFVYETEWDNVFSSGAVWTAENGCSPGYFKSEFLACSGYVEFGGTRIEVQAAGATGTETMALEVDGQVVDTWVNVSGDYEAGVFLPFVYHANDHVSVEDIRVLFTNDGDTPGGDDRNLRIDSLRVGDLVYQAESETTFSTGSYDSETGCAGGNKSTEYLVCNGYFQFSGTRIEIRAAGATGQESMDLLINGQTVASFDDVGGDYNQRGFVTYTYDTPIDVDIDQVRVAFTNDGITATGVDKNLRVDSVSLNGITFESEASNVLSTGTWLSNGGCNVGNKASEFLHCGGYLQFDVDPSPGTLALGTSLISVNEEIGSIAIPFVRNGGSDGSVSLDYTTVNGTAVSGQDFTMTSGTLEFAPGETNKNVVIPINDDAENEGNETFAFAVDRVGGGAVLGQPRTATITIVDDDQGPTPGTGNGLLGIYFDDATLEDGVIERTDQTIDFDWGSGSPDPAIAPDTFSVRWVGQVEPLYSQTYTFHTTSDDGVRLWVDSQLLVDQWNDHDPTVHTGQITLQAGQRYDLRMEYYDQTGGAVARLEWSSPSQTREIVPQIQLYSDDPSNILGTFSGQTIISGLSQPTTMEFAAGGRMFIAQKNGIVRLAVDDTLLSEPFLDISEQVNNVSDRGLLGMAVHPQFPSQPYVYLLFTYDPPETQAFAGTSSLAGPDRIGNRVARLIRVTADPATNYATAMANSELVLLGSNSTWVNISNPDKDGTDDVTLPPSCAGIADCLPTDSQSHSIGSVVFGNDGALLVTVGDGTSYGRVDPRTVRTQDLDSLAGKILRIDPLNGDGYSDNPFYTGDVADDQSKVYSYGVRNSFRSAVHPVTGELYSGDVGWTAWEEINVGAGKNFGWPYYEGGGGQNLQTGGYEELPEAEAFYASAGLAEPPLWSRPHSDGARAIVVGDFYQGSRYPSLLENALFFSDYGEPTLRALLLQPNGDVDRVLQIGGSVGVVVEMQNGADGYMYYVDIAAGQIGRLEYTEDALNAAAQQASLPQNGGASSGVAIVPDGNTVEVFGKDSDNVIEFDARHPKIVTIDGVQHALPVEVTTIKVHGGLGEDQLRIHGSNDNDDMYLHPTHARLQNPELDVSFYSLASMEANAFEGTNDRVFMYDAAGDDTFESSSEKATLHGNGFSQTANGFDRYYAYATSGGSDTAIHHGTTDDDFYRGSSSYSRMVSKVHFANASGFEISEGYSGGGKKDRAVFYDSANDETFTSRPNWSSVDGGTYSHEVHEFRYVSAFGGAGNDVAHLFDSAGNDKFYGYPTSGVIKGKGFQNMANGYGIITAHASSGKDRAYLIDSELADYVHAQDSRVRITSDRRDITANDFDIVVAKGTHGGDNVLAKLDIDFRLIKRGSWRKP